MKLEAVTPFLGKYRPFVGRCCQTCTPKSWVSDVGAGPHPGSLGKLDYEIHGCGKQLPLCLSEFSPLLPMPLLFSPGDGCTRVGCIVSLGLASRPGRVGWRSAERGARVWPEGWGLAMPA